MTRSREEFDAAQRLLAEGLNDCEVSRITGIPRSTVKDWRSGARDGTSRDPSESDYQCGGAHDFSSLPPTAYSYLLGMYLGDGYIARHRRGVFRLRIVSDNRYPGIIDECSRAMEAVMPGKRAYRLPRRPSRCIEVSMYSKHWPCLFPQHGPGRKHNRPIHLEPWQEQFVKEATQSFLRGLIHSDGCRVMANDRGVKSVRYHFSNRSEDIKRLFCASLDSLGIKWTRPSDRQIAVYRKDAVARLDHSSGRSDRAVGRPASALTASPGAPLRAPPPRSNRALRVPPDRPPRTTPLHLRRS